MYSLLSELRSRGLASQSTPGLDLHLAEGPRTVYCGFDPTADSLHIGSLVPLLALRRFQLAGHRPVALVGGATGLVGDPSFKASERSLNPGEVVVAWTTSISDQVSRFLDLEGPAGALVVNNFDWFQKLGFIDFLRDIGKHFSVNAMMSKDSVRQRIEREGEGLSFAEFSYMLMQAYDFAELHRRFGCTLQIGGSDQWGNITGGIDLCRRLHGAQVHGLTLPLITKADGSKFGKTESGTVWLDPSKTSPYAFYQFWLQATDADVYRFLGYFTFLRADEIEEIRHSDEASAGKPSAQRLLAREVTRIVHGEEGCRAAERISQALFSEKHELLSETDLMQLRQDGLPCTLLGPERLSRPLTSLLVEAGMASSGKQVKDALSQGALRLNGEPCRPEDNMLTAERFAEDRALYRRFFLARLGRRTYHLFELDARPPQLK